VFLAEGAEVYAEFAERLVPGFVADPQGFKKLAGLNALIARRIKPVADIVPDTFPIIRSIVNKDLLAGFNIPFGHNVTFVVLNFVRAVVAEPLYLAQAFRVVGITGFVLRCRIGVDAMFVVNVKKVTVAVFGHAFLVLFPVDELAFIFDDLFAFLNRLGGV
jgi:hypothetical protein